MQEAIRKYLPLLLDDEACGSITVEGEATTATCWGPSGWPWVPDTASTAMAGPSTATAPPTPLPGPWAPARHEVPVAWVEQLVDLLPHTELLPFMVPSTQHLRYVGSAYGRRHEGQLWPQQGAGSCAAVRALPEDQEFRVRGFPASSGGPNVVLVCSRWPCCLLGSAGLNGL